MIERQKGFTLIELLIYMSLMSIFLLVLLDIFTTTLSTKLASESTSVLSSDSRYILSKLSYDVNNADAITFPSLGSASASLQLTASGSAVIFASNSGNLVKTVGGVSMSLNSLDTKLNYINFKNIGNAGGKPTIQVIYTLRSKIVVQGGGSQTQTINTTVGAR